MREEDSRVENLSSQRVSEYVEPVSQSILEEVKGQIDAVSMNGDAFDREIKMDINICLATLQQLGVVAMSAQPVEDDSRVWSDWIPDEPRLAMVKGYVFNKVRLLFDPPMNSSLLTALQSLCDEFEWRGYMAAKYPM